jgi:predicted secreted acid phosphatase
VDQGLKLVKTPYLPPVSGSKKYTLVLDLDETLLHFEEVSNYNTHFIRFLINFMFL